MVRYVEKWLLICKIVQNISQEVQRFPGAQWRVERLRRANDLSWLWATARIHLPRRRHDAGPNAWPVAYQPTSTDHWIFRILQVAYPRCRVQSFNRLVRVCGFLVAVNSPHDLGSSQETQQKIIKIGSSQETEPKSIPVILNQHGIRCLDTS